MQFATENPIKAIGILSDEAFSDQLATSGFHFKRCITVGVKSLNYVVRKGESDFLNYLFVRLVFFQ